MAPDVPAADVAGGTGSATAGAYPGIARFYRLDLLDRTVKFGKLGQPRQLSLDNWSQRANDDLLDGLEVLMWIKQIEVVAGPGLERLPPLHLDLDLGTGSGRHTSFAVVAAVCWTQAPKRKHAPRREAPSRHSRFSLQVRPNAFVRPNGSVYTYVQRSNLIRQLNDAITSDRWGG